MTAAVLAGARPVPGVAVDALARSLVPYSFPSADDVASVAASLAVRVGVPASTDIKTRYRIAVTPGTVSVSVRSMHGLDEVEVPDTGFVQGALLALDDVDGRKRESITEWSRGSRRRMVRHIAELDFSQWSGADGMLAMVTLTLPGQWEHLVPTGAHFKRLVRALMKRWSRSIGTPRGIWKLEFQRRGAPHLHALMRVPALVGGRAFEDWLADTWADVVGADDQWCHRCDLDVLGYSAPLGYGTKPPASRCSCAPGARDTERARHRRAHGMGTRTVDFSGVYSDPRRISVYFVKHSSKTRDSKEYQHVVPALWQAEGAGPGRFWGVWGLSRAVGVVEVDLATFHRARRILRGLSRGNAARIELQRIRSMERGISGVGVQVLRAAGSPSPWAMRARRVRGLGASGGGWVLVNDGLAVASDLERALSQ